MLFSSSIFVFLFLPIVLFGNFVIFRKHRTAQNVFLLICSLFFYAWGEPLFVLIMIFSIFANWLLGLLVVKRNDKWYQRLILTITAVVNLSVLFVFKYLMFTLENINSLFGSSITVPSITLPIGISFFTFQAMSYVIDVYRGHGEVQKNPLNVGLYVSFFPQLIAGPIVRYETIADQIQNRKETMEDFTEGICRFIVGLGKKMLLSNTMAIIADAAFANKLTEGGTISVSFAWLGAIAYTFQIFFDFSGYSDMAIGLGRMFGFHFLENFNYPYISTSVSEFWRRWHISLGTWFRDYVYIPLGGNRVKSKGRLMLNLFVVWFLTGVWHGANWTFITWGLMYFVLLAFEKITRLDKKGNGIIGKIIKRIYTLFFVVIGWVIFRADNLGYAIEYIKSMLGLAGNALTEALFNLHFSENIVFLIAAIIFSMPVAKWLSGKISSKPAIHETLRAIALIFVLILSLSYVVKGTYNPFIYFNF
ncbi:MAG: MBOAT family protein [Clostridia bacterium]|nr:MBOAT family protein [Clostridia bacterium]